MQPFGLSIESKQHDRDDDRESYDNATVDAAISDCAAVDSKEILLWPRTLHLSVHKLPHDQPEHTPDDNGYQRTDYAAYDQVAGIMHSKMYP